MCLFFVTKSPLTEILSDRNLSKFTKEVTSQPFVTSGKLLPSMHIEQYRVIPERNSKSDYIPLCYIP